MLLDNINPFFVVFIVKNSFQKSPIHRMWNRPAAIKSQTIKLFSFARRLCQNPLEELVWGAYNKASDAGKPALSPTPSIAAGVMGSRHSANYKKRNCHKAIQFYH